MNIIRDPDTPLEDLTGAIVTIGNFDGVHLGHREIFRKIVAEAQGQNTKAVVITFDPHPQKIIHPERRPFFLLTPLQEKLDLIASCGVDAVILLTFSPVFADIIADRFVEDILWEKLHLSKLFIGYDYVFGKGKGGNAAFLRKSAEKFGFAVEEIGVVRTDGMIASSTNIRLSILAGNVSLASEMLGRPYSVSGTIVKGYRRGTDIVGYPTANIKSEKVIPAAGVYAVFAELEGIRYRGVINIGNNPTFGNEETSAEVHLLDFEGDIYDKNITLFFIDRLRDERKFKGPEELTRQIQRDIEKAKAVLSSNSTP